MEFFQQNSPLPHLGNADPTLIRPRSSFVSATFYEGAAPVGADQLFKAKSINLNPRAKTSLGTSRSSPGFASIRLQSGHQPPPPRKARAIQQHMERSSTKGKDGAGKDDEPRSSNTPAIPRKCLPIHQATVSSTSESLTTDISSTLQSQEAATASTDTAIKCSESSSSGMDTAPSGDSFIYAQSSSRGQVRNIPRRRASSATSRRKDDASGRGSVTSSSANPDALKSEIRRLQAALMNGFSGGNRFVGGSQFKASCGKRRDTCVGCQQTKEALRRSKVEACDLRGSLLRAELVINQLTRTNKVTRYSLCGARDYIERGGSSPISVVERSGERGETGAQADATGETCLSQEKLLTRVRQLEQELRLADCRHSRDMEVGAPGECEKCAQLEERLLAEASKVSGLMQKAREQQQKLKDQQDDLAKMERDRADAFEMRRTVDALTKRLEAKRLSNEDLVKQKAARDADNRRLVGELNRSMKQALENGWKLRKLSKQHGELQLKASATTQRLEQTKADLAELQVALDAERASRSSRERDMDILATNVAREHTSLEEMKDDLFVAREDRRRLKSQVAATEAAQRNALKAALSSCIRPCVVAPTVNINLRDRRHSFWSGFPEEKLRAFVEGYVLPRFTRVLLQPGSEYSMTPSASQPCGAATSAAREKVEVEGRGNSSVENCGGGGDDGQQQCDFDKWLKELLVDMQASIERHVAGIFEAQQALFTGGALTVRQPK